MNKAFGASGAVDVGVDGYALLTTPLFNKGTAFPADERDQFELHGLLPPHVGTIEDQSTRRLQALDMFEKDIEKYVFLRDLQDTNETLFYAVLTANLEKVLPLVYTPTVGEGCQRFSEIWRKPRGLFLSYPNRNKIREILATPRYDQTRIIVVSDGERILGLGDQGAGGMGIPIGKLSLYTGCAGIHPQTTLPILLDVGTDNQERLNDPLYVGWRHERVRGAEYDAFVDEFVTAVAARWPDVLLQWEDFAGSNAARLLERYRDRLCTFNDDIQGTAAVAAGTLLAAINVTGIPLTEQRVALLGAGSAGAGIAALLLRAMVDAGLAEAEARRRFYAVDRNGLLVEGMPGITHAQEPFVRDRNSISGWKLQKPEGPIGLEDVVANARPTVLIGVSGQAGAFTEAAIREMARHVERPVIMPLSNPTSRAEATPVDLMSWTDGRALIGTGSPFAPVAYGGQSFEIAQTNNAYIFPGVGLGVLASGARRVSDGMFMAAALALADLAKARKEPSASLLPATQELRAVAAAVALSVAQQARKEGLAAPLETGELDRRIREMMWAPAYRPYRRVAEGACA